MRTRDWRVWAAVIAAVCVVVAGIVILTRPRPATAPAPTATALPSAPASPTATPTATPGCTLPSGAPPSGNVAATFATALAFAPDGQLFFAERSGRIRVASGNSVRDFATVPTVTTEPGGGYSERGLLGLALSPAFSHDHYVFAFYSQRDYTHQVVVRFTDCGGTATAETVLAQFPSGSDCCHKGGRLAFGPDGKLYVTLGDEHHASAAQDAHDVRGKILRYNLDGSLPGDNPFGAGNPVYAYGLRNPFGIAFGSDGTLLVTNNGPSGDAGSPGTGYDTVDIITAGSGHQWPLCYGYSHPLQGGSSCGNQPGPDWSSEQSTVVPTGATFVDSHGPAQFAGHFVFCTYNLGMLILTPGTPHATVARGPSTCHLDVKEGPDHAVYFSDATTIYRVA